MILKLKNKEKTTWILDKGISEISVTQASEISVFG